MNIIRQAIPFGLGTLVLAGSLAVLPPAFADDKQDKKAPAQAQSKAEQKVKDPVCGMEVDPKTAEKSTYKGKTYYFCSREEKQDFDKTPEKYVKKQ